VIVLANLFDVNPTGLARQIADICLEPEFERAAPSPAPSRPEALPAAKPEELDSYAGLYWSDRIEGSHRLEVEKGELRLLTGEGPYPLAQIGPGSFQLTAAPRRFVFTFLAPDTPGGVRPLRLDVGGKKPVDYERVESWRPETGALAAFAGEFSSDEGLAPLKVATDGSQLRLLRRKFKPAELSPIVRDVFQTPIGVVRFLRGPDGHVTALELTTDRSRHLRFDRTG
jgi:hypothetical protein